MECVKNKEINADEFDLLVDQGYEEALTMKTIDISRTEGGEILYNEYAELYNSVMEAAEEKGMDTKLIARAFASSITFDRYLRGVREKLIRNHVI